MIDFLTLINRVLSHEGNYSNDPADPGGETKFGISKRSYPHLNIKDLTREEAIEIYYKDFWVPLKASLFSFAVQYQLLDFAVNSGIPTATRYLQRAVGVADDGHWGPFSQAAAAKFSESDLIMNFTAERMIFQTRLKNWPNHGKGWTVRNAENLRWGAKDTPL